MNHVVLCQMIVSVTIAFILNFFVVSFISEKLKRYIGDGGRQYKEVAKWLGCIESPLYALSWFLGHPEFLAVWLGFKSISQWSRWSNKEKKENEIGEQTEIDRARARFNLYLLGNALTIFVAIVAVLISVFFVHSHHPYIF